MTLLPKPVSKNAKTSFFSRRTIFEFFSSISPNFTSHTRCISQPIYYNFVRIADHQSDIDDRYVSSIMGQPNKTLYSVTGVPHYNDFRSSSDARATYGSRPRISRSHAHDARDVLRFSFLFSLRIFEQKRDCSQSIRLVG